MSIFLLVRPAAERTTTCASYLAYFRLLFLIRFIFTLKLQAPKHRKALTDMTTDNANNLKSEIFISTTRTRVGISPDNFNTHHSVRLLRVDAISVRLKHGVNVSENPYFR